MATKFGSSTLFIRFPRFRSRRCVRLSSLPSLQRVFRSLLISWPHAHYLHCRNSLALISVLCRFCFFVNILYPYVLMTSTIILEKKKLKSRVFKISTNKWTPFICRDFGFWFFFESICSRGTKSLQINGLHLFVEISILIVFLSYFNDDVNNNPWKNLSRGS